MWKLYILVDLNEDCKELKSEEELKDLAIRLVKSDVILNSNEREVVEKGVKLLENIARYNFKGIKETFDWYGYKIIDLIDLQRDLEDVKDYFLSKQEYVGNVCETIDLINKEINGNDKNI